jgi:hypothetical protein
VSTGGERGERAGESPSGLLRLFGAVLLTSLAIAAAAYAQDDGPRVYQLAPEGAKTFTTFAVAKRGNETPESGDVVAGSKIDTNMLVFRYAQTFSLGGRQLNPFVILPMGEVRSTVQQSGGIVKNSSSGLGDAQFGVVLGLLGAPALSPELYAAFRPGFSTGLLARAFFPTGAYSAAKPVNLGSNRYSYQLGFPTTLVFGQTYLDPTLTALELLPTITFYDDNSRPYGAARVAKAPQFAVESHLTHNFGRAIWLSADMLYRLGGETTTGGRRDDNAIQGWSAGMTAALRVAPAATVILTYEHVVERNDDGPDGWFFRTAVVVPFR